MMTKRRCALWIVVWPFSSEIPMSKRLPQLREGPFRTVSIIISVEKYNAFHRQVVDVAVGMTDESMREFFDGQSYEEDFVSGRTPEEVAEGNVDACEE